MGTCISLPNIGYNPAAAHAVHFIQSDNAGDDGAGNGVYEDLAYNIPRKFESFWPESKVLAIQTNGGEGSSTTTTTNTNWKNALTPKCRVTGEGCSADINPNLHLPSSRVAIDFDGPTRRGGRLIQSSDVTMLDTTGVTTTQYNPDQDTGGTFYITKTYSQYNRNQDLQTFYREISSFQRLGNGDNVGGGIVGKIRVAAFLPYYIKEMDATTTNKGNGGGSVGAITYNENEAVAIYDYKVLLKSIDEIEAATM